MQASTNPPPSPLQIQKKLLTGIGLVDPLREGEGRSPSPEPVYDSMGIRTNTREFRAREKLTQARQVRGRGRRELTDCARRRRGGG